MSHSTAEPQLISIPVEKLLVDPDYQARATADAQQVARLKASDPKSWPELLVTPNPKRRGTYLVIDGQHRILAGRELENGNVVTSFPCRVVPNLGYEASVQENLKHLGLQLSTADRKAYAVFLHEQHPDLSGREVARRVGLDVVTVLTAWKGGPDPASKPSNLSRSLTSIIKAEAEREGMGGGRPAYVAHTILNSKDPEAVVIALDGWIAALTDGLEQARAKLAG